MNIFKTSCWILIGTYISLSLLSCSSEPIGYYYSTPIVTGQVLDKRTLQPIENASISQTTRAEAVTDSDGYFKLPSYKFSYDISTPNSMDTGSFYIYKEGYKEKDYWNFGLDALEIKHTSEVPYHIHLGTVYLEPLPKNINKDDYIESNYIKEINFCNPNESQKEVNCMPLPDGVDYETL
ncbi:hypothetical protein ACTXJ5_11550 [Psychrobacter alimentarius]|uniref:hypothetical protein n=1 Tax=Psychrobacter alimentarius TaxID=261164 RepID=UPI003FD2B50C